MSDAAEPGMGLMGHLLELRLRTMRALLALGIAFLGLLPFANDLYARLAAPLLAHLPDTGQLIAVDVASPFFAPMKLTLFVALLVAVPVMLYHFAYFVLLPAMFAFLTATVPDGVAMMPDINAYLSFVLVMGLAAGLAFEMPIAVLVALMLGWVTPAQLSEWRGYVVVAIAILAALLTPPDGLSMILLMVPMWLLYEAGLLVGRLLVRPKAADAA